MTATRRPSGVLELTGLSHTLRALPVGGDAWVGMISVRSPVNGSAMLTREDAEALREWLTERIEQADRAWCAVCDHGETLHGEDDGMCMVADCPCGAAETYVLKEPAGE